MPTLLKSKAMETTIYQAFRSQVEHAKGIFVFPPSEVNPEITRDIEQYSVFAEKYKLVPVKFNALSKSILSIVAEDDSKQYQLASVSSDPIRIIEKTTSPPSSSWYFALGSEYIIYYNYSRNTIHGRVKVVPKLSEDVLIKHIN
jgi:hypothetical protein